MPSNVIIFWRCSEKKASQMAFLYEPRFELNQQDFGCLLLLFASAGRRHPTPQTKKGPEGPFNTVAAMDELTQ